MIQVLAELASEFSWPHDFWRRMGWREFQAWTRELGRRRRLEAEEAHRQRAEAERQRAAEDFYRQHGIRRR